MTTSDPGEFLTVAEIAATLKLNPQTIRNWLDADRIPYSRLGRRVRVGRSDFDASLSAHDPTLAAPVEPVEPPPSIWDGHIPTPVA